jgi:hypothetical protein
MHSGSLFTSAPEIGPTAVTFVGEATVRFKPRPEAERQQLAQFAGRPELTETVRMAFVRLHPADFHHLFPGGPLEPDPTASSRLSAARRFHAQNAARLYALDTTLPRSPWWLMPSLGDATVSFATGRRGVLTYSLFRGDAESISLTDRARRRQICLYPSQGRDTDYDEDEGRPYDATHHQLYVRIDPRTRMLEAVSDLTLDVRAPTTTLQLNLADGLRVDSVTSEAGEHLFFRIRHQDSIMIALGALAGRIGPLRLHIQYGGTHESDAIDSEALQVRDVGADPIGSDSDLPLEDVSAYTNRIAWYPQVGVDDYATAELRLEVPPDYVAVAGGALVARDDRPDRRVFVYRQDRPAKYQSVVVGRLVEGPAQSASGVALRTWTVRRARNDVAQTTAEVADILAFYTREFGPAPYPDLNLVIAEARAPGGHSPPGMVLLNERPPFLRSSLVPDPASFHDIPGFFLAHELAHQWWGQGVSGQNYRERWISEGMAQYAAALWARSRYGEERFRDVLRRMARWAHRETGAGPIHLGQRLGHLANDPQVFRAVVYDKGAYVAHMLRSRAGEEPFRRAMHALQADNRFGKIGTRDVQHALEAASGLRLDEYFEAWIYGTRLPQLRVTHRSVASPEGQRTTVDVVAENLPGPVATTVFVQDGGAQEHRVELAPGRTQHTFLTAAVPRRVEVNRDLGLLATIVR